MDMGDDEEESEFEFDGDIMASEVLCDHCKHGRSGNCTGEPPCSTYKALERVL
jgi:hypothetical protein